jgi:anti-anti-sigma factor
MGMSCEVEKHDDEILIRGEMTIYNAVALKNDLFAALAGQTHECALDLSKVSEIDTTGLQTLFMVKRACRAGNVALTLVNPSAVVRDTLELLRVSAFSIASTTQPT